MTRVAINLGVFLFVVWSCSSAFGQTFARSPAASAEAAQLQALSKKIDEQNAKIDTLSQQILKLEQQISNLRPGVMVGEATPAAAPSAASAEASSRPPNGNTHVVARGETLTSIAKMHGVTQSTISRWLQRARVEILRTVRDLVRTELDVDDAELDSLLRALRSQVDFSFSRLLGDTGEIESRSCPPADADDKVND